MPKLLAWFAAPLIVLLILIHYDDKPRLLISPACAPKPLPNPCATMRCVPKGDPRIMA